MEKITVRMCEKSDIEAVSKICIDGWRQAFVGIVTQSILDSFDYEFETKKKIEQFETRKTGDLMCVAEVGDRVKGFCLFDTAKQESMPKEVKECGEIVSFYVDPNSQRMGIGKALFAFATDKFRNKHYEFMVVWTLTNNKIGRSFYEKMGGIHFGKRERILKGENQQEVGYIFDLTLKQTKALDEQNKNK